MSTLKAFSAAVILSAAVVTPVLAQPVHHIHAHLHHFRGAYNQMTEPFVAPRAESGRAYEEYTYDRSFPGGDDPSKNPAP